MTVKRVVIKRLCAVLAVSAVLSGCGALPSRELEQAYSFEERSGMSRAQGELACLPFFAEDLCVAAGDTEADLSISAEAGALFDVSRAEVLYSKNALEQMYPASTTKIMTALIAIEEGNLEDTVTVTDAAVITEAGATLCGIKPGDRLTLLDLLYGLMLPSGNDAANAIAVHMSGSVEAFAERMNERARRLGATGTHFMNPSGLHDENHYTTAYDLYLMFNEALKYPLFRDIIGIQSYTADYTDAEGNAVSKTWNVGNWYQKGDRQPPEGVTVLGGKTGTTQAAGNCLVMGNADASGAEYISIVMKAAGRPALYDNMSNIIAKIVK
jgi:D-alanyl-D-alanine carboxypeptidase (penicillin-binding protein 5/6)